MPNPKAKPKRKAAAYTRVTVRIPDDIFALLQAQAEEGERPMNTQIIVALRAGLGLGRKQAPMAPEL